MQLAAATCNLPIGCIYVQCIIAGCRVAMAGLGIRSFAHLLISLKSNERL